MYILPGSISKLKRKEKKKVTENLDRLGSSLIFSYTYIKCRIIITVCYI